MAILMNVGQAGTVESNDIMVTIAPASVGSGIQIELTSGVIKQFGRQIKAVIESVVVEYDIKDALIHANDKGALDCTIRARVKSAIGRAIRGEA